MIKLVVSDFDGVLLPHGADTVSKEIWQWIARVRRHGIYFAIATGRTYGEMSGIPYGKTDCLIGCDGAYYEQNGKAVYERKIEKDDLLPFFQMRSPSFACLFHGAHTDYAVGSVPEAMRSSSLISVARLADIPENIYKITSFGAKVDLPARCGLRMHWDGGTHAMAQYVHRFANKGAALSNLQNRLGFTPFETVCLGDGENDIPMMRNAVRTCCVGGRSSALAQVCTDRAATAEEAFALLFAPLLTEG